MEVGVMFVPKVWAKLSSWSQTVILMPNLVHCISPPVPPLAIGNLSGSHKARSLDLQARGHHYKVNTVNFLYETTRSHMKSLIIPEKNLGMLLESELPRTDTDE